MSLREGIVAFLSDSRLFLMSLIKEFILGCFLFFLIWRLDLLGLACYSKEVTCFLRSFSSELMMAWYSWPWSGLASVDSIRFSIDGVRVTVEFLAA